ncbi:MAG TPA: FAD-linked oxidase [Nitrospiraceae bacterium]|jgi:FAD/FMN-containing dehydrogenase|nr:FAD-linked oxidase [Nitrospiraceae bacterium]
MGTVLAEETVRAFGESLHGELIRPSDEGYDRARRIWNGMIDRYPAMIVFCKNVDDVIESVYFARVHDLLVAVRSGGHNVAGTSVCNGGMVIDLSRMKEIEVNPAFCTARAQAGLNWGELDRATQFYGLATTGGIVSRTGIAGLTLGGGIGWLMRKFGVTCDNLLSVNVVTADGRLLTARAEENQELFWGVRGGGGNFGIVTEFEYRLHKVGLVLAGTVYHPAVKAREILRFYRDYIADIPDELTTMFAYIASSPTPFLHRFFHGSPVIAIHVCYTGRIEVGEKVVKPLRVFGPPIEDAVRIMHYTELQSMLDSGSPAGLQNYWKSSHLMSLSDEAIELLSAHAADITSPLSQVHLQHLEGAVGRVGEDEMAFSHRDALCVLNIVTRWEDPKEAEEHMRWTRDFEVAMRSFSTGGVYVNFLGEEGEDRVKAAYGRAKYNRLATLKNKYDPTNFFRLNQNIKPASL